MRDDTVRFACPQLTKALLKEYGSAAKTITVAMRACDDVPNFIRKVENAHRQTAQSTLRFGPTPTARGPS